MLEYALPFHSHATPTSRPDAAAANPLSPHARAPSLLDHSLPPSTLAGARSLLFPRAFRAAGGRSSRRHPRLNLAACAACLAQWLTLSTARLHAPRPARASITVYGSDRRAGPRRCSLEDRQFIASSCELAACKVVPAGRDGHWLESAAGCSDTQAASVLPGQRERMRLR